MFKLLNKDLLKDVLEKEYNISVEKIEKNSQSTDGNVFIIYTEINKYIVKIYKDFNHTKSMIELYKNLKDNNISVPEVIKTNKLQEFINVEKEYIIMYSFLDGESIKSKIKGKKLDNNIISAIAYELRKLHTLNKNCKNELPQLPFEVNQKRKSILHFDLTKDNIFINENNKISFIDFDDAKFGASICDVAILISTFFFSKTRGVDIDSANKFINSYYKNEEELKKIELTQIKDISLKWINYILDNNKFDSYITESFEIKRDLIKKYLNTIDLK